MQVKTRKNEYLVALKFAFASDYYENVSYHGQYKDFAVYLAMRADDVHKFVGLPSFVLVKGERARWATADERFIIMNKK